VRERARLKASIDLLYSDPLPPISIRRSRAAAIIGGVNQAVAQAISSRKRPVSDQLAERLWSFIASGLSLEQHRRRE
jgi:hypothetical protein